MKEIVFVLFCVLLTQCVADTTDCVCVRNRGRPEGIASIQQSKPAETPIPTAGLTGNVPYPVGAAPYPGQPQFPNRAAGQTNFNTNTYNNPNIRPYTGQPNRQQPDQFSIPQQRPPISREDDRTPQLPSGSPQNSYGSSYDSNRDDYHSVADPKANRINWFALELFNRAASDKLSTNLVLSPVLLQYQLSILEICAGGRTKAQLIELNSPNILEDFINLLTAVPPTILHVGNGIFLDESTSRSVNRTLISELISLNAKVDVLDFRNYNSRDIINRWASDATKGTIRTIIPPSYPLQNAKMILASAVYFKSIWKYQFNKTASEQFYNEQQTPQNIVEYMHVKTKMALEKFRSPNGMNANIIELPYIDGQHSMVLIVPDQQSTIKGILSEINHETFKQILYGSGKGRNMRQFTLKMPKFNIDSEVSLSELLKHMGLNEIFSRSANFEKLTRASKVDDILQKASLTVDEYGSTAAAVTVTQLIPLSADANYDLVVTINKPFIAVIVDSSNKIPLFISSIYNINSY